MIEYWGGVMTTKKIQALEKMLKKPDENFTLLENSPIGISVAAPLKNKRFYTNSRFNEMFASSGLTEISIYESFVDESDFENFKHMITHEPGRSGNMESLRRSMDGREWWCYLSWHPAPHWEEGAFMFWHFDITEQKEKNALLIENENRLSQQLSELQKREETLELQAKKMQSMSDDLHMAKDELELLNEQKDRFFSIIAHDLKSPLDGLMGFTELMMNSIDGLSRDHIKEYASYIHRSSQDMHSLLISLLSWSRVQMKQMKVSLKKTDLNYLVMANISLYALIAGAKNVKIQTNIDDNFYVLADEEMLSTILRNIINNAVKFSHSGDVVTIDATSNDQNILIEISDTGVGMSPAQIEKIFDLGARSSTPGTGGETGTGLGLLLCKEFAKAQGGEFYMRSFKGQGTKVSLVLSKG